MRFLILALLISPFAQDEEKPRKNEAEKLYDKMVETIKKAKSLHVAGKSEMVGEEDAGDSIKIDFYQKGKKFWLEGTMTRRGKERASTIVSDGEKFKIEAEGGPRTGDVPKNFEKRLTNAISRGGITILFFAVQTLESDEDVETEVVETSEFEMGEKKTIGSKETQGIKLRVKIKGEKDPADLTLWIDTKTNLPVQSLLKPINENMPKEVKLEETYEKIELNPEISDDKFKVGEEKKEEKDDDDK